MRGTSDEKVAIVILYKHKMYTATDVIQNLLSVFLYHCIFCSDQHNVPDCALCIQEGGPNTDQGGSV